MASVHIRTTRAMPAESRPSSSGWHPGSSSCDGKRKSPTMFVLNLNQLTDGRTSDSEERQQTFSSI